MGLRSLLLIACLLACFFERLRSESSEKPNQEFPEDLSSLMSSLFGFRPCLDEDCDGLSRKSTDYRTSQDHTGAEYPSRNPQVHSPNTVIEHCLPLHTSTLRDVSIIENRHPDIKDSKLKVIEDLIGYVAQLSVLNAENCDPATKLLDFILLATQTLRQEYLDEYGAICNYTISDGKSQHPDKDEIEVPPQTSKCVDPDGVTPNYVSTEEGCKTTPADDCNKSNITVTQAEATAKPCPDSSEEAEEIIAEVGHVFPSAPNVGSVRGIPGVHYPNYTDVPVTSFSCADKKYIPGFYADLETGCQIFHVCYEHRRESFLCPVGTTFNQPILACDYWYSSNCSLASSYYDINAEAEEDTKEEEMNVAVGELISVLLDSKKEPLPQVPPPRAEVDITKFLPVKAKITEFKKPVFEVSGAVSTESPKSLEVDEVASQIFNKIVSSATDVVSTSRGVIDKIAESGFLHEVTAGGVAVKSVKPIAAKAKLTAAAVSVPVAKAAAAKVAVPIAVKTKLSAVPLKAAAKAAVPLAVKTKLAAVPLKAAVPVGAKAKLAAAVPKVAVKASVPVFKAKMAVAAVPATKSKIVASVLKGIKYKAASAPHAKATVKLPLVKSSIVGIAPVVKAKLGTAAAISPLTKKALALGYMKLLKSKKLALLG